MKPKPLRTALFAVVTIACSTNISFADEDGVSFWVPGFFGSLAAVPQQPGWSLTSIYYHTDVSASGNAAVAREITLGQFNPKININVNAKTVVQSDAPETMLPLRRGVAIDFVAHANCHGGHWNCEPARGWYDRMG